MVSTGCFLVTLQLLMCPDLQNPTHDNIAAVPPGIAPSQAQREESLPHSFRLVKFGANPSLGPARRLSSVKWKSSFARGNKNALMLLCHSFSA